MTETLLAGTEQVPAGGRRVTPTARLASARLNQQTEHTS